MFARSVTAFAVLIVVLVGSLVAASESDGVFFQEFGGLSSPLSLRPLPVSNDGEFHALIYADVLALSQLVRGSANLLSSLEIVWGQERSASLCSVSDVCGAVLEHWDFGDESMDCAAVWSKVLDDRDWEQNFDADRRQRVMRASVVDTVKLPGVRVADLTGNVTLRVRSLLPSDAWECMAPVLRGDVESHPVVSVGDQPSQVLYAQQDDFDRHASPDSYALESLGVDVNRAKRYVYHAFSAYAERKNLERWSCKYCKKALGGVKYYTYIYDKKYDGVAYLAVDAANREIVVSFRGSSTLMNWIQNLKVLHTQVDSMGGKVSSGFLQMWNKMAYNVRRAVVALRSKHPGYRVIITGHSLGAALAQLCGYSLKQNSGITAEVWGYGSPRVGNQKFADSLRRIVPTALRFTHKNDVVVHLPTRWMGYRHASREYYEGKSGSVKTCDGSGEDSSCARKNWMLPSVADHLKYLGIKHGV